MSAIKLTVLGVGSRRNSIPVISSLATYFGERPLDIAFYDADEERLDLFDRFARLSFLMMKATHSLSSSTDFREALDGARFVVLQVGENCARKELGRRSHRMDGATVKRLAIQRVAEFISPDAHLLDLSGGQLEHESVYALDWPPVLPSEEPYAVPFQILRWLNGEEYPYEVFREQEHSPLKQWLDDPSSLPVRSPK
jgi:hypothetical protein